MEHSEDELKIKPRLDSLSFILALNMSRMYTLSSSLLCYSFSTFYSESRNDKKAA